MNCVKKKQEKKEREEDFFYDWDTDEERKQNKPLKSTVNQNSTKILVYFIIIISNRYKTRVTSTIH